MDELLSEFLSESFENLDMLAVELVELERSGSEPDRLAGIFRTLHGIKGTCGFWGLSRLERLAHAAENVLGRIRADAIAVTPEVITLVLQAVDRIRWILERLEATEAEPPGDDTALVAAIEVIAAGGRPALPAGDERRAGGASPAEPAGRSAAARSLRVPVDLLEHLTALVSELVLTRDQLLRMPRDERASPFEAPLQRLSQITSALREGVVETRMQPVGHAWARLPRLVRDLGHTLHKRIELETTGAETMLDRDALELIKEPLVQIVRNAADHGIEPAEDRRRAGKPEQGTVTLHAYHADGRMVIEIADDGRGLDADEIARTALQQGLVTTGELAGLGRSELLHLILRPGFSTAQPVSAVSGRGVGLDLVKSNVATIGGGVEVDAQKGRGTRVTLTIPLTLVVVAALIVEAGGERFAIPRTNVVEVVGTDGDSDGRIEIGDDAPALRRRERSMPLLRLTSRLGASAADDGGAAAQVVVSRVGGAHFGIVVDVVLDTAELVVTPVAPALSHVGGFAGTAILADGSVVMVLDLASLARDLAGAAPAVTDRGERAAERGPTALLEGGGTPAGRAGS